MVLKYVLAKIQLLKQMNAKELLIWSIEIKTHTLI